MEENSVVQDTSPIQAICPGCGVEILEVEKPDLEKLDARLMTIDDFLNDNN